MRLIWIKPNAESKLYRLLQSQFACRRNIWREKPVRHFAPAGPSWIRMLRAGL
jgi:hypothetical protein